MFVLMICSRNEDGRLRMRSDITMEGPAYAGRKSSRSAVFESTDEKKLQAEENATSEDEGEGGSVGNDDSDDEDDDDNGDLHLVRTEALLPAHSNLCLRNDQLIIYSSEG